MNPQAILEKYGWLEGQGLGKNNTGITKPLKASLKFDKSGLGHDVAVELTDNWWERVYDNAANNLEVIGETDEIKMALKTGESVEITTSRISKRKLKNSGSEMAFGTFVKTSTLTNEGKEVDDSDKIDLDRYDFTKTMKNLTDEELLEACGGRTAHKGARHGLKLSGKLARLAEQDNIFLEKLESGQSSSSIFNTWTTKKESKKRNKNKKVTNIEDNKNVDELHDLLYTADYSKIKSKKKKKRKAQTEKELTKALQHFNVNDNNMENDDRLHEIDVKSRKLKKVKNKKDFGMKNAIEFIKETISDKLVKSESKEKSLGSNDKNTVEKRKRTTEYRDNENTYNSDTEETELEDSAIGELQETPSIKLKKRKKIKNTKLSIDNEPQIDPKINYASSDLHSKLMEHRTAYYDGSITKSEQKKWKLENKKLKRLSKKLSKAIIFGDND